MPISDCTLPLHPIQAAVLRRLGGPLRIETLELEGPRDDEILVRLVASGICRTDIDFCDEWYEGGEALVLGHEGAGVVEMVGRSVQGFAAGDPVILSYQSCALCLPIPASCSRSQRLRSRPPA
jgi:aryl-alcohol dehydrogenase